MAKSNPWQVEADQTYCARGFWMIWRKHPSLRNKRQYVMSPSGTDRRRFYNETMANNAASKLNEDPTT